MENVKKRKLYKLLVILFQLKHTQKLCNSFPPRYVNFNSVKTKLV